MDHHLAKRGLQNALSFTGILPAEDEQRDVVRFCEFAGDVKTTNLAAGIEREKPAGFHPEDLHLPADPFVLTRVTHTVLPVQADQIDDDVMGSK